MKGLAENELTVTVGLRMHPWAQEWCAHACMPVCALMCVCMHGGVQWQEVVPRRKKKTLNFIKGTAPVEAQS